ncbi:DUF1489 family protein [Sphingomonas solaris]|uniref:DUF1489 family protein n=1 Tax=Alterirhizorhabdus solaris TaxID=2529389 RepID=A0A558R7L5_9SPHN|nr:DUF1489 family protein [Sphingomonas solaris]TVV75385.1 DUF1489 family protein [Sphingomonas solaris]
MALHLTKVAVGCGDVDVLHDRMRERADNGTAPIWTRYRPTRHAELIGGSLFWIIKHRIVARQAILGFEEIEDGRRWLVRLDARVVPVRARFKRAHQGWRYLAADDAPGDVDGGDDADALAEMPNAMREELSALALI